MVLSEGEAEGPAQGRPVPAVQLGASSFLPLAAVLPLLALLLALLLVRRKRRRRVAPASRPKLDRKKSLGNALRNLDPALQELGRACVPGQVVQHRDDGSAYVVRVALTGGPCAGKSSVLAHLTEEATKEGFDVVLAPEIATLIFNSGFKLPPSSEPSFDKQRLAFQTAVTRLQLGVERQLVGLAASTGRPTIVVFDRGVLDGKGYMDETEWKALLATLRDTRGRPVDEEYCLNRYDGCVHLVTAADGAERFYKQGRVVGDDGQVTIRNESAAEARALDERMRECWKGHPHHIVVRNTAAGFPAKLQEATHAVLDLARRMHPQNAGDFPRKQISGLSA